jgi:glycosyltransferase involved in cell wall biosynthesis
MKVCLVSQEYPPETPWGGIGTQTRNKAHALARRGHEVHVITCAATAGSECRTEMDAHVTLHRIQPPGYDFPVYGRSAFLFGYTWNVLQQLDRLNQSIKLDVVDFPEFGSEGFAYQLDRTVWNWIPVVVQLHGPSAMFVEELNWPLRGSRYHRYATFTEEMSVQMADGLMACSANIADLTSQHYGVARDLIDVVHCGVDEAHFIPASNPSPRSDRPTVLFVGNVVENKGLHIVFDAVMKLRSKYPEIRLQIVGEIPRDSDMIKGFRERIAADKAESNFEFAGYVMPNDLPNYYRRANVFCSPAEFEGGVANVYLEAMACGCPIVVSTAGGGPEAVVDGKTGLLVPPNDVQATVDALDTILGQTQINDEMGVASRIRVEDYFAMDKYIDRVLAVYEKAIVRSQQHPDRWKHLRE